VTSRETVSFSRILLHVVMISICLVLISAKYEGLWFPSLPAYRQCLQRGGGEASTYYEGLTMLHIRENLFHPKLLISLRIAVFVKLRGYKFRKMLLSFLNRLFRNFPFLKKKSFILS
jgi:hypothetical protein